jgi:hypothetical protein
MRRSRKLQEAKDYPALIVVLEEARLMFKKGRSYTKLSEVTALRERAKGDHSVVEAYSAFVLGKNDFDSYIFLMEQAKHHYKIYLDTFPAELSAEDKQGAVQRLESVRNIRDRTHQLAFQRGQQAVLDCHSALAEYENDKAKVCLASARKAFLWVGHDASEAVSKLDEEIHDLGLKQWAALRIEAYCRGSQGRTDFTTSMISGMSTYLDVLAKNNGDGVPDADYKQEPWNGAVDESNRMTAIMSSHKMRFSKEHCLKIIRAVQRAGHIRAQLNMLRDHPEEPRVALAALGFLQALLDGVRVKQGRELNRKFLAENRLVPEMVSAILGAMRQHTALTPSVIDTGLRLLVFLCDTQDLRDITAQLTTYTGPHNSGSEMEECGRASLDAVISVYAEGRASSQNVLVDATTLLTTAVVDDMSLERVHSRGGVQALLNKMQLERGFARHNTCALRFMNHCADIRRIKLLVDIRQVCAAAALAVFRSPDDAGLHQQASGILQELSSHPDNVGFMLEMSAFSVGGDGIKALRGSASHGDSIVVDALVHMHQHNSRNESVLVPTTAAMSALLSGSAEAVRKAGGVSSAADSSLARAGDNGPDRSARKFSKQRTTTPSPRTTPRSQAAADEAAERHERCLETLTAAGGVASVCDVAIAIAAEPLAVSSSARAAKGFSSKNQFVQWAVAAMVFCARIGDFGRTDPQAQKACSAVLLTMKRFSANAEVQSAAADALHALCSGGGAGNTRLCLEGNCVEMLVQSLIRFGNPDLSLRPGSNNHGALSAKATRWLKAATTEKAVTEHGVRHGRSHVDDKLHGSILSGANKNTAEAKAASDLRCRVTRGLRALLTSEAAVVRLSDCDGVAWLALGIQQHAHDEPFVEEALQCACATLTHRPPDESVVLECAVVSASNLAQADEGTSKNAKSDPYCMVFWNDQLIGSTYAIMNDHDPEWHGPRADFNVPLRPGLKDCMLRVEVRDHDKYGVGDLLGQVNVPGDQIGRVVDDGASSTPFGEEDPVTGKTRYLCEHVGVQMHELQQKANSSEDNSLVQGTIGLRAAIGEDGMLECWVAEAHGLAKADAIGLSDPYCMVFWNDIFIGKTKFKKDNHDPVWTDEVFHTPVCPDHTGSTLRVEVRDYDGKDSCGDLLGQVVVKGDELMKHLTLDPREYTLQKKMFTHDSSRQLVQGQLRLHLRCLNPTAVVAAMDCHPRHPMVQLWGSRCLALLAEKLGSVHDTVGAGGVRALLRAYELHTHKSAAEVAAQEEELAEAELAATLVKARKGAQKKSAEAQEAEEAELLEREHQQHEGDGFKAEHFDAASGEAFHAMVTMLETSETSIQALLWRHSVNEPVVVVGAIHMLLAGGYPQDQLVSCSAISALIQMMTFHQTSYKVQMLALESLSWLAVCEETVARVLKDAETSSVKTIRTTVYRADGLAYAEEGAKSGGDKSDPFVTLYWNDREVGHTPAKQNDHDPVWRVGNQFLASVPCDPAKDVLRLEVRDWDDDNPLGDFLGQVLLDGSDFAKFQNLNYHTLGMKTDSNERQLVQGSLGVRLNLFRNSLEVEVVDANDLASADADECGAHGADHARAKADAFVVVFWNDIFIGKTEAVQDNNNPVWHNATFTVKLPTTPMDSTLRAEVRDFEETGIGNFMGQVRMTVAECVHKLGTKEAFPLQKKGHTSMKQVVDGTLTLGFEAVDALTCLERAYDFLCRQIQLYQGQSAYETRRRNENSVALTVATQALRRVCECNHDARHKIGNSGVLMQMLMTVTRFPQMQEHALHVLHLVSAITRHSRMKTLRVKVHSAVDIADRCQGRSETGEKDTTDAYARVFWADRVETAQDKAAQASAAAAAGKSKEEAEKEEDQNASMKQAAREAADFARNMEKLRRPPGEKLVGKTHYVSNSTDPRWLHNGVNVPLPPPNLLGSAWLMCELRDFEFDSEGVLLGCSVLEADEVQMRNPGPDKTLPTRCSASTSISLISPPPPSCPSLLQLVWAVMEDVEDRQANGAAMAAAKAEADAAAEREKEQRNAAATRLQAQHRGLLARKEVEEMARRAAEEAAKGSDDSSDCMTDEEDDDQSHVKKWDAAEDWDGKDEQGIAVQFFELQRKKNTQEKQIVQGARPPRPAPPSRQNIGCVLGVLWPRRPPLLRVVFQALYFAVVRVHCLMPGCAAPLHAP